MISQILSLYEREEMRRKERSRRKEDAHMHFEIEGGRNHAKKTEYCN
jgi:hypothetical protein